EDATLGIAELVQIECIEDFLKADGKVADAVKQREDAEVLVYGQVAGERRVDGGKVGAGKGAGSVAEQIDAADRDGADCGLEHAEDHGDGGGFAGAVDAEEANDFSGADVEGDAFDSLDRPVMFAQVFDAEDGFARGDGYHRLSDAIIRRAGA